MNITVMGIDPGITGAIVLLRPDNSVSFEDMPTVTVTLTTKTKSKKYKTRTDSDQHGIARIIGGLYSTIKHAGGDVHVILEKQAGFPEQHVSAVFGLARSYGILQGILASFQIPYTEVTPANWKKFVMPGMNTKDKATSALRATQLFPKLQKMFYTERGRLLDGRAEALLLAWYGQQKIAFGEIGTGMTAEVNPIKKNFQLELA